MKSRHWLFVISLVFIVIGLDQITKYLAVEHIRKFHDLGALALTLHRNPGAMLGMFSDLPPLLRVVSLSTGGVFLVFIYAAIQYLLPKKSLSLRCGLSILLGGILGNVIDRTFSGSVVDFLILRGFGLSTAAFNVSDALQWVGYGLVVHTLLFKAEELWPSKDDRKSVWINPSYQKKYIGILIVSGACFALIAGVFSFTYLEMTVDDLNAARRTASVPVNYIQPFFITFSIISFSFLVGLFIIGRYLSHRTAGPLYAFEKYLDDLLEGKDRDFKLRQGDEFQHLEEVATRIRSKLDKVDWFSKSRETSTGEDPSE